MPELTEAQRTIGIIKKYGFTFHKHLGQNFLIDSHVIDKTIKAAHITKQDVVLEIGAGIGTLTRHLCEAAGEVVAVEIDKRLVTILREDTLSTYDNVTVINGDILGMDIHGLVRSKGGGQSVKIVANLPYYITTPIIMGIFEKNAPVDGVTVMVQKEVARRINAAPGTKDYGAFTLAVRYYAKPYVAAYVPTNCFIPRPNVDSAVVTLTPYKDKPVQACDEGLLFKLIRAAFNQRRKTLVNAVNGFEGLDIDKDVVADALEKLDMPPMIRGEALSLEEFAMLANYLFKRAHV